MESDSLFVVNAITQAEVEDFLLDIVIAYCLLLVKEIPLCKVSFAKRSTNQEAHLLAKTSVSMTDSGVWFTTPPVDIDDVLRVDNE